MTFGELVELLTFEAPAAVGAFLRARFVPTQAEVEHTMERIGANEDEFFWRAYWQWRRRVWLALIAHEKRMRAMG